MVVTGDREGCGTDSQAYITIYGRTGITPRIELGHDSSAEKRLFQSPFARGVSSKFVVRAPSVGALTRIRISQDGEGELPHWFIERIVVTDLTYPKWTYYFNCGWWLSPQYADGKLNRLVRGFREPTGMGAETEYRITFYTGDRPGAGTSADVFVQLKGETGISREIWLNDPPWSKDQSDAPVVPIRFNRNSCIQVALPPCQQYGQLTRLTVGHNNRGDAPRWFLDKVIVDDLRLHRVFEFPCHEWIDTPHKRQLHCKISRQRSAASLMKWKKLPIEIRIFTGDSPHAGTTARVYLRLRGPSSDKMSPRRGKHSAPSDDKSVTSERASTIAPSITSFTDMAETNEAYTTPAIWLTNGAYEKSRITCFRIDLPVPVCISPLTQLEVGHDNSGKSPAWFLDKVCVNFSTSGVQQTFMCGRWLSKDKEDGKTERTLFEDISQRRIGPQNIPWLILVKTSDMADAGTSANVGMSLYGNLGRTDDLILDESRLNDSSDWLPASARRQTRLFQRGIEDEFRLDLAEVGTPFKLRINHDNRGTSPDWHLEKVVMINLNTDQEYVFFCNRWLSASKDDRSLTRELPAQGVGIIQPEPICHYRLRVFTGNKPNASTNSRVFVNLFGENGDTGNRWLLAALNAETKPFQNAQTDEFQLEAVDLRRLSKLRIGHDGVKPHSGWYLAKVEVDKLEEPFDTATFECHRWLDTAQDDGMVVRELMEAAMADGFLYKVTVQTGKVRNATTTANVYACLYGKNGETGALALKESDTNTKLFDMGSTDVFQLSAGDVGELIKVRLWHDGSGLSPGWFVDEVSVAVPHLGLLYIFAMHRWLDANEADGRLSVDLEATRIEAIDKTIPYEVMVFTGDKDNAGTEASVHVQFYGTPLSRCTDKIQLMSKSRKFTRGAVDKFKIHATDISFLQKMWIEHDATGSGARWFLDRVLVRKLVSNSESQRSSPIVTPRDRQTRRARISGNSDQSSPRSRVKQPSPLRKRHERNVDLLSVDEDGMENYWFIVNDWLVNDKTDNQNAREVPATTEDGRALSKLVESRYEVLIQTGNANGSGTSAKVHLTLFGTDSKTGDIMLQHPKSSKKPFQQNSQDCFNLRALGLGGLRKIKLRHDGGGLSPAWFLDHVLVREVTFNVPQEYWFPCYQWFSRDRSDGLVARELALAPDGLVNRWRNGEDVRAGARLLNADRVTCYLVRIITGSDLGAGTDANVHIEMFSENEETGIIPLKTSRDQSGEKTRNKFEAGSIDSFTVKVIDVGALKKIRIGHDSSGVGASWQLDRVEIDAPKLNRGWTFLCDQWIARSGKEKKAEIELYPQPELTRFLKATSTFAVKVFTAENSPSNMTATVSLQIYGKNGETGQPIPLLAAEDSNQPFGAGAVDVFHIEAEEVPFPISKMRILHDNKGLAPHWLVKRIELQRIRPDGQVMETYVFPCERWLSRSHEDSAVERELVATRMIQLDDAIHEHGLAPRNKLKRYEVRVVTGEESGAGTDANVFLTLYGELGDSGDRKLAKSKTFANKFETGHTDVFDLEAVDLGRLMKARVRHDDTGIAAAWFLDRIEVIPVDGDGSTTEMPEPHLNADFQPSETQSATQPGHKPTIFHCERWLSSSHEDNQIERLLFATDFMDQDASVASIQTVADSAPVRRAPILPSGVLIFPRNMEKKATEATGVVDISEADSVQSNKVPTMPYHIRVVTGSMKESGTPGPVWIRCYNRRGRQDSGKLMLFHEQSGFVLRKGVTNQYTFDAPSIDDLAEIEVCNEAVPAADAGWYLRYLHVDLTSIGKRYQFTCNTWLSRKRGDGQTLRCFPVSAKNIMPHANLTTYQCVIQTSDAEHAGTDSDIFIQLFGTLGMTDEVRVEKYGRKFERGSMDRFSLELHDVGELLKLRIRQDGQGDRNHWKIDSIEVTTTEGAYSFHSDSELWLSSKYGEQKRLWTDLVATRNGVEQLKRINLKVTVKTSNLTGSGTNSSVFIRLIGEHGDSGDLQLKTTSNNQVPFKCNALDDFMLANLLDLGTLAMCRIWQDNRGSSPAWHCEWIEVTEVLVKGTPRLARHWRFNCAKWLSTKHGEGQLSVDIPCAEQFIQDPVRGLLSDQAVVNTMLAVAQVAAVLRLPDAHVGDVAYPVDIMTGTRKQAGTNHSGWLQLEGSQGQSRRLELPNHSDRPIFQLGGVDQFRLLSPPLGKLQRLRIGLLTQKSQAKLSQPEMPTALKREAQWFANAVRVRDPITRDQYMFKLNRWISPVANRASWNEIVIDVTEVGADPALLAVKKLQETPVIQYKVTVHTGDKMRGGTDANVFLTIYGDHPGLTSGRRALKQEGRNLFERKQIDVFSIVCVDLGNLQRLLVEQDFTGTSANWFLEKISVTNTTTGEVFNFPCGQWLAKKRGDGRLWKELLVIH